MDQQDELRYAQLLFATPTEVKRCGAGGDRTHDQGIMRGLGPVLNVVCSAVELRLCPEFVLTIRCGRVDPGQFVGQTVGQPLNAPISSARSARTERA